MFRVNYLDKPVSSGIERKQITLKEIKLRNY